MARDAEAIATPARPGRDGSAAASRVLPPFERVVTEHGAAVLRFCAAQLGRERAEDCFQETMLAALRAYPQVRDPGALRAWLLSIAARKALDAHRSRARAPHSAEGELVPDDADGADGAALRDEGLWGQVRGLPDKQRMAVTLRYLADLTHAEVAGLMGTTEAAARRNVHEGLRRLRREAGR